MAEKMPMDFGNYVLQDLIARGGMAEIYRAKMRTGIDGFEKPVAIKKILPNLAENDEFITMLIDEARISVTMNHANIAQVYDLGRVGESYYIAMEYIPGVDLSSVIKKLGKDGYLLPLDHATFITKELCAGLYYAHSKKDENGTNLGVVHRDISPHNVLVSFSGNVKVIDFGVAKASVKLGQTRMGVIKGKLLYMAPEQAMAKQLDCRADIFSAGLCLYRMLTGHLPFEADSEFQIYNNVLTAPITPPNQLNPEIPADLNQVVMKSLERDVNQRYADAWLMHQDLERVLHRVAPGYTMNRLSAFMNEYFADERPAPMGAEPRVTSPSYPSAPSVQSGRYGQPEPAPNTPSNFQPAQVRQPVSAQQRVSAGGPTVPMSAAEIAAALPPLITKNAPPHIPSPEELGFKPRNPAVLEDAGEFDADPTVDMQLDPEALQRMSQMARARPSNQRTQIDPKAPKAPAANTEKPASRLPLILGIVGAGLLLLVVVAAILIFALGIGQGDEAVNQPPVAPPVVANKDSKVTSPPAPSERAGSAPAALKAASTQVADAHRKVYDKHSATISLTVYTRPQGAAVYLKRDLLGETPLTVQIPRGDDPVALSLQLDGYDKATTEVVPSTDRKAVIELTERAGAAGGDKTDKGDKGDKAGKGDKTDKAGDKAGGKKNGELLDPW
jgi:serine/threonine protein kinase